MPELGEILADALKPKQLYKVRWKADNGVAVSLETPVSWRDANIMRILLEDYFYAVVGSVELVSV